MELLPFFDLYGITLTCVWGGFGERYLLRQIKSFILYGIRPSYLQCIAYLIFHKKKKISKFVGGGGGGGDTFFFQKQSFLLHGIRHNLCLQYIAYFNI